jgi:ubiquitin thioesterase protein OTUB1
MEDLHQGLFQQLQATCPQVIPTLEREKTVIEVSISRHGAVENLLLYGDSELTDMDNLKRSIWAILYCREPLPYENNWQITVFQYGLTSIFIPEKVFDGVILELGVNYICVKCEETRVFAFAETHDLCFSAQCKLARNGFFFEVQPLEAWDMRTLVVFNASECPVFNEEVDLSAIDINVYPRTCGEQRLPILSLSKVSKYNAIQGNLAKSLSEKYTHWRRIRGDGDCYYRSVAVCYMEHLCRRTTDAGEIMRFEEGLKAQTNAYVLREFAPQYKHFVREVTALAGLKAAGGDALSQLQERFKDLRYDQSAAATFRCIAWYSFEQLLNTNPDFSNFLDHTSEEYFSLIRTKGKEAEGLIFRAVAQALNSKIVHVTLDAYNSREDIFAADGPGEKPVLTLLLKPGHYDVLYPFTVQATDQYIYATNSFRDPPLHIPIAVEAK